MPNEILLKILKRLPLYDLFRLETTINKKWKSLIDQCFKDCDEFPINTSLIEQFNSVYNGGILTFNSSHFMHIIEKTLQRFDAPNLKSIRLNGKADTKPISFKKVNERIIKLAQEKCPKLECLNFVEFNFKNREKRAVYESYFKSNSVKNLRKIVFKNTRMSDAFLELVFENCPLLENLSLIHCENKMLTGKAFAKISTNNKIKKVRLEGADSLTNRNFLTLFEKCKQIEKLKIEDRCLIPSKYASSLLSSICDNLTQVKRLHIPIFRADHNEVHKLSRLIFLEELCVENYFMSNKALAEILNKCTELKTLKLNGLFYEHNFDSSAFALKPIKARLEHFEINYIPRLLLDDKFMPAFMQYGPSLTRLSLYGNRTMNSAKVNKILDACPKLSFINVSKTRVDNQMLEKAYSLKRDIKILCQFTRVSMGDFKARKRDFEKLCKDDNDHTVTEYENRKNMVRFRVGKLLIETDKSACALDDSDYDHHRRHEGRCHCVDDDDYLTDDDGDYEEIQIYEARKAFEIYSEKKDEEMKESEMDDLNFGGMLSGSNMGVECKLQ